MSHGISDVTGQAAKPRRFTVNSKQPSFQVTSTSASNADLDARHLQAKPIALWHEIWPIWPWCGMGWAATTVKYCEHEESWCYQEPLPDPSCVEFRMRPNLQATNTTDIIKELVLFKGGIRPECQPWEGEGGATVFPSSLCLKVAFVMILILDALLNGNHRDE